MRNILVYLYNKNIVHYSFLSGDYRICKSSISHNGCIDCGCISLKEKQRGNESAENIVRNSQLLFMYEYRVRVDNY